MAIRVIVEDPSTGERLGERVIENDYMVLTDGAAYVDGIQTYQKTHVLTIKGLKNGIPTLAPSRPAGDRGEG